MLADRPHILAFNTADAAQRMCSTQAIINGVDRRIDIRSACTSQDLKILIGVRGLIISDCEGYEISLFGAETCSYLTASDFIIEVHEHNGASLQKLMQRFEATHSLQVIFSLTDVEKATQYYVPAIKSLSFKERAIYLAECRLFRMPWLVGVSKEFSDQNASVLCDNHYYSPCP